ncbi:MAG: response regulator [Leptodesmis sp.]|uniref:response regulator n=1 Tax=Leptodesmis sp. TaxID=3100501 RepID=UPI003D14C492
MSDIQVILVEDDEQTRVNLRAALRAQDGIEVASEATNGTTGLVLLESIDVDVAIADSSLPDMDLAEFVTQMQTVQTDSCVTQSKLLILLDPADRSTWETALTIGADSYCRKDAPIEQIAEAVKQTYAGQGYRDPAIDLVTLT